MNQQSTLSPISLRPKPKITSSTWIIVGVIILGIGAVIGLSLGRRLGSTSKGKVCGGIANLPCPTGFRCKLDGSYPDAGGKCVN